MPGLDFYSKIKGTKPVLVDFYADWCEPCKWLEPVLNEVKSLVAEKAQVYKIDIEKHPDLKEKYSISSVPVLIIFKNGVEHWRMNGFTHAGALSKILLEFAE